MATPFKIGDKVTFLLDVGKYLSGRKITKGTIVHINGGYIHIKPAWLPSWYQRLIEVYPNEIERE